MNETFKDYSTSCAFRLDLSKRMINALLCKYSGIDEDCNLNLAPYKALARRGLLRWDEKGLHITKAGKLTSKLLIQAGFKANANH